MDTARCFHIPFFFLAFILLANVINLRASDDSIEMETTVNQSSSQTRVGKDIKDESTVSPVRSNDNGSTESNFTETPAITHSTHSHPSISLPSTTAADSSISTSSVPTTTGSSNASTSTLTESSTSSANKASSPASASTSTDLPSSTSTDLPSSTPSALIPLSPTSTLPPTSSASTTDINNNTTTTTTTPITTTTTTTTPTYSSSPTVFGGPTTSPNVSSSSDSSQSLQPSTDQNLQTTGSDDTKGAGDTTVLNGKSSSTAFPIDLKSTRGTTATVFTPLTAENGTKGAMDTTDLNGESTSSSTVFPPVVPESTRGPVPSSTPSTEIVSTPSASTAENGLERNLTDSPALSPGLVDPKDSDNSTSSRTTIPNESENITNLLEIETTSSQNPDVEFTVTHSENLSPVQSTSVLQTDTDENNPNTTKADGIVPVVTGTVPSLPETTSQKTESNSPIEITTEDTRSTATSTSANGTIQVTEVATQSNSASSTLDQPQQDQPSVDEIPIRSFKWYVLQFTGNCTEAQNRFDDFKKQIHEKILSRAGIPAHEVTLNVVNCSNTFLLNVSVSQKFEESMSQFFSKMEANATATSKLRVNEQTYNLMNVVTSNGNNAYHHQQEVILSSRHTDIEFVIYVALGSACAFLLALAVILLGCKYCHTKPYKSFALNDISHLSLRMEDYTLTRIPRPKSMYTEYGQGIGNKNQYSPLDDQSAATGNGMVHPYDTSIVPLEDAPPVEMSDGGHVETQAFGRSTQTSPTNHDYEEIDVKAVKSTENLHSHPSNKVAGQWGGVDNVSFSTP